MSWEDAYLRALGVKPTAQARARLASWQRWEGGATNNSASNNYMNTKQRMPGSWDAIGNGVQGYKTLAQGAQAFARTVKNGNYPNLVGWIASGQGDPSHDLQVWVAGPGGVGSPSAVAYAQKVLGGHGGGGAVAGGATPTEPGQTRAAPTMTNDLGVTGLTQADVRSTAAEGFAAIAQRRAKPEDTFGALISTLKQVRATTPRVAIPRQVHGGSTLEEQAANLVHKYLGVAYKWGGTSPQGFDCSGLLQYVWGSLGVKIPRTSEQQWNFGKAVDLAHLQPGDAVFTEMRPDGPGHVGMYIGDGKIIAAPHTGTVVQIQNLSDWHVAGARRFA